MPQKEFLGIDVGASGIKGAIVDIKTGELLSERMRLATPTPSTPKAVAKTFAELVERLDWKGSIGCGFPSVIKDGVCYTAANIEKKWIGTNAEKLLSEATGCNVFVSNDADLAGLAEMRYGVGKGQTGSTLLITIGSGLGSALFVNEHLVPNTELGHVYLQGHKVIGERYAADSIRKKEDLSWEEWGVRFNEYLLHIDKILRPKLIILGGGGSKKFDRFSHLLTLDTKVVPAELRNNAGIIGGAIYAYERKALMKASKSI